MDKIACDYAGFYLPDANIELLLFALRNGNEIFLKYALQESIFSSKNLADKNVVDEILTMLANNSRTEFLLNCLNFANFSQWP